MNDGKKITVLVVDDHPLMRVGIIATINAQPDMKVVAQAGTAEEAIRRAREHVPEIALMDLRLPDLGGVEAIRAIRSTNLDIGFVVLTTYEGDEDIHQAFEAGAQGYVIKGMSYDLLLNAIRKVHRGTRFLPPPIASALTGRDPDSNLSARERDVLALLVQGRSNREIATELGITEGTVKCHVSVILMRLDVADRTQAVVVALRRGIAHL